MSAGSLVVLPSTSQQIVIMLLVLFLFFTGAI
jgi:hypothetical protein